MLKLNHSINLVTEIDENKMPDHLLMILVNLSEVEMETLLRETFINALESEGVLEKLNKDNSWATLKLVK
jgi:hypothetical protein